MSAAMGGLPPPARTAVAGWFVGQVMKATQCKASPDVVNKLLKEQLGL